MELRPALSALVAEPAVWLFVSTADAAWLAFLPEFEQALLRRSPSPQTEVTLVPLPRWLVTGPIGSISASWQAALGGMTPLPARGWDLPGWVINGKAPSTLTTQEAAG